MYINMRTRFFHGAGHLNFSQLLIKKVKPQHVNAEALLTPYENIPDIKVAYFSIEKCHGNLIFARANIRLC